MEETASPNDPGAPSLWAHEAGPAPRYPALAGKCDTDVVIVGGGFTGLHAALALAEHRRSVIVLEARQPGWGASGRNGGQVIPGLHVAPPGLVKRYGRQRGERWARHALTSADLLFETIRDHALECEATQPGYLYLAHTTGALRRLAQAAEEVAPYGGRSTMLGAAEARAMSGSGTYTGGKLVEGGGSVQPLKLCFALARAVEQAGATIHGNTPVEDIREDDGRWRVTTPDGGVTARGLLLATNCYTGPLHDQVRRGLVRVCSFQAATAPLGERAASVLPDGHAASDTRRLLHYFRRSSDGRLVMGGRAPFKPDVTLADTGRLRRGVAAIYPEFATVAFEFCWAGWVGMTLPDLPVLARIGRRGFAVYGFNGTGVALSCLMGRAAGALAGGGSEQECAVPVEAAKPVPLHRFSRLGAQAWIAGLAVLDRLRL